MKSQKQVTFSLGVDDIARLHAMAAKAGFPLGRMTKEIVLAVLDDDDAAEGIAPPDRSVEAVVTRTIILRGADLDVASIAARIGLSEQFVSNVMSCWAAERGVTL